MRMFITMLLLGGLMLAVANVWQSASAEETGKADKKAPLRHVVVFRFKEGTPKDKIHEIETAFAALPKEIDTIVDYEWGINNSPEGLNDKFTHCFLVTFADTKGRDAYLPHPAHKKFVTLLKPHLDKAFVIDYIAQRD